VLGTLHQRRAQGIALDVPEHDAKVLILFDWECFEPSLPHVTGNVIMTEVATGMRGQQPMGD
jgi:hypothetical protein